MTGALAIRNVSHWLGDGDAHACVLAPIDYDFLPGRLCCVSGPSGTGKTTLLSILAAVVRPTHGMVMHAGVDLARATDQARLHWRRRQLGLVFQTSRLIDVLTTAEHMALVARLRRTTIEAAGVAWLHKLGLGHRLNNRPSALSGGEKQRVALAQALAPAPAILLADEPTAALDSSNARLVACVLADYAAQAGAVVVAVSHDPILIDAANDRIDLCRP